MSGGVHFAFERARELGCTTMQIFVDVRRNLNRVTNDVHLLTEVARRPGLIGEIENTKLLGIPIFRGVHDAQVHLHGA